MLVLSWLAPLRAWAIALVGAVSTVVFVLVAGSYRALGRRMLAKPAVVATGVMYVIALFTLAYASIALTEAGSIQTDGAHLPGSLGVAALLATAMGIAGGEVGVHVQEGARVIAHVQLLVIIGAVAGVGGQVARRLSDTDEEPAGPSGPPPRTLTLELYARVYERLSERGGDVVLDERQVYDPEMRRGLKQLIGALPPPDLASDDDALDVFRRIDTSDLEYFYPARFEGNSLGNIVRAWLRGIR